MKKATKKKIRKNNVLYIQSQFLNNLALLFFCTIRDPKFKPQTFISLSMLRKPGAYGVTK